MNKDLIAQPVAMVIAMDEGAREPRIVSWNAFPIGTHHLYAAPQASQSAPTQQALSDDTKAAYDKVDRFLRNNLDDADYAEHSEALEAILAAAGGSKK